MVAVDEAQESSPRDNDQCKVCMDAAIDCILLECGHMVSCTSCGKRLAECPICRRYVSRIVHVFRAWVQCLKITLSLHGYAPIPPLHFSVCVLLFFKYTIIRDIFYSSTFFFSAETCGMCRQSLQTSQGDKQLAMMFILQQRSKHR